MATKYGISGQLVASLPASISVSALFLPPFSVSVRLSGEGEFIPFTRAWRWRAAATAVQSWMWLMRNEIPALVVHFCRWLTSLAFADANRAARQRPKLESAVPSCRSRSIF